MIKGCIFDLDGVICDTARFHFIAWKELADGLGIPFDEEFNEKLKGVSRVDSLELILKNGNLTLEPRAKDELLDLKNQRYLELVNGMSQTDILPGMAEFIFILAAGGILKGVGSSSKNAKRILDKLRITGAFEAVVDGTMIENSKPHPEVFLKCADMLGLHPSECVVMEDAQAGIEAAKRAGMIAIGVGTKENLPNADTWVTDFRERTLDDILKEI